MTDIALCTGGDCDHKERCARYTIPSVKWEKQEWLAQPPFYHTSDGWTCPEYIENPPPAA